MSFFGRTTRHFSLSLPLVLVAALTTVGCSSGGGGDGGFSGSLSGAQVVPAAATANSGTFQLVDRASGQYVRVTVNHTIPDLTGITINGPAVAGVNAPALFDVLANRITTRGSTIDSPIVADWEIDDLSRSYLEEGELYVLLTSTTFPLGELRGQVNGPTSPPQPEGNFTLRGFNTTYIDGTLVPPSPKFAGNGWLENGFSTALALTILLESGSADFPFVAPPNATESTDSITGELRWDNVIDIPANFSEFFGTDLDMGVSQDLNFNLDYSVRAASNPNGPVLDTGNFSLSVNYRPESHFAAVVDTFADIDDDNEVTDSTLRAWTTGLGITARPLSFTGSTPVIGTGTTQITGYYAGAMLDVNFGNLITPAGSPGDRPCGAIDGGEFVCPVDQASTPNTGPWLITGMLLEDNVPLNDATNLYTYGFVMDGDGNPNNNFVNTNPDFENDFFQGTDLWYTVEYNPTNGWSMFAIDASGAGNPQRFFTDAAAIIRQNIVLVAIPMNELPTDYPDIRFTAFRHTGDFGQSGPFGLDYDPGLGEPLLTTFDGINY